MDREDGQPDLLGCQATLEQLVDRRAALAPTPFQFA
jgi:hypothetical protein